MIKLEVKPYCMDCPNFSVRQSRIYRATLQRDEDEVDHIIACENADVCRGLMKYLDEFK